MQPSLQPNGQTRRRGPGRPWPKGTSGNPAGKSHHSKSKRYVELHAGIVSEFGKLTPAEMVVIDHVTRQLIRSERTKDAALAARCSRTAQSWLKDLRERRAIQAGERRAVPSLGEMLNGG
jgi:hypothetical protein